MSQENVEIVRRVFDAFNERDAEAVVTLWAAAAEWRPAFIGGGLMEGAVYRGHAGVREFIEMQNETWATVVAVGIAAAGGIGASVVIRFLERQQAEQLEGNTIADGLILWVRARSPDREERAQQILRERGGQAIRVHEIEIDKRLEDLPLSKLRPDPWLGGERLGHL